MTISWTGRDTYPRLACLSGSDGKFLLEQNADQSRWDQAIHELPFQSCRRWDFHEKAGGAKISRMAPPLQSNFPDGKKGPPNEAKISRTGKKGAACARVRRRRHARSWRAAVSCWSSSEANGTMVSADANR